MAQGELRFADRKGLELYTKLRNKKKKIQQGEKAYIKDKAFVWDGENWCEYKAPKIEMSVYDMNEQLVAQLAALTDEQLEERIQELNDWYHEYRASYYMLMCKEQSYYTVLTFERAIDLPDCANFGKAIVECLSNIGEIKDITYLDDNTYECWVQQNEVVWCLHLFDYSQGIVTFGD